MIVISQIDEATKVDADFVRCPVCKGRLCDKAKGTKTHILQFSSTTRAIESLLIKCSKCGNRFMVSSENDD